MQPRSGVRVLSSTMARRAHCFFCFEHLDVGLDPQTRDICCGFCLSTDLHYGSSETFFAELAARARFVPEDFGVGYINKKIMWYKKLVEESTRNAPSGAPEVYCLKCGDALRRLPSYFCCTLRHPESMFQGSERDFLASLAALNRTRWTHQIQRWLLEEEPRHN